MKTNNILMLLFFALSLSTSTYAQDKIGNGGDICEYRIKSIRDDLISWIKRGGASGLQLSPGKTTAEYESVMLDHLSTAQISCVTEVLKVNGAEKTCKNFFDAGGVPQIICNNLRFLAIGESDQYLLVHHEYAGLTGFEVTVGTDSDYSISNQITGFLEDQIVKLLAVRRAVPAGQPIKVCVSSLLKNQYGDTLLRNEANAACLINSTVEFTDCVKSLSENKYGTQPSFYELRDACFVKPNPRFTRCISNLSKNRYDSVPAFYQLRNTCSSEPALEFISCMRTVSSLDLWGRLAYYESEKICSEKPQADYLDCLTHSSAGGDFTEVDRYCRNRCAP